MAAYGTNEGGVTYFATRLNSNAWDEASETDRTAARTQATNMIDALAYRGERTDASQDNQFPRDEDASVPTNIEYATYELSLWLLDDGDPQFEEENLRVISQGYGNVRSTYDTNPPADYVIAGIYSVQAWRFLVPYLRDPQEIRLKREF